MSEVCFFTARDNELQFAGLSISQLRALAGRTPFYVYDRAAISARIAHLRQQLPADVALHYAIKANPHPSLLAHIAPRVDGLDVASARELALALATPTAPHDISFAGPGKTYNEIRLAVAAGVVLHIESLTQLQHAQKAAQELHKRALIGLRVNPDFELKSSGMKMSGGSSVFGIDVEQLDTVLATWNSELTELVGWHFFCGSQNLQADHIAHAQRQIFALAKTLLPAHPTLPRYINIGGGFGIPYFNGEKPLDIAHVAAALHHEMAAFKAHAPSTKIVIELGRFLVGEAGLYVCEVVDKKISRGRNFLICNGGLHHHLSAAGLFGQVIRKNYPIAIANRMAQHETETVNIHGPLCTPLDVLAQQINLPKAEIGDLVAIAQSGAYGLSASPRAFLAHPDAVEVVV